MASFRCRQRCYGKLGLYIVNGVLLPWIPYLVVERKEGKSAFAEPSFLLTAGQHHQTGFTRARMLDLRQYIRRQTR